MMAGTRVISRRVAIKTVRLPDANDQEAVESLDRFKREAQAAGRLTHPNIVGVFDYGETDEVAYIVMEFVAGRSLKEMLDGNLRLPVAEALRLMGEILAGLAFSHARGVVHRDIKPANIMVTNDVGQAKIADFGIARIEASSMTQAGTVMGTPAYMSPEQFMGQVVDQRTDIYSCGILLYQLLTGETPLRGQHELDHAQGHDDHATRPVGPHRHRPARSRSDRRPRYGPPPRGSLRQRRRLRRRPPGPGNYDSVRARHGRHHHGSACRRPNPGVIGPAATCLDRKVEPLAAHPRFLRRPRAGCGQRHLPATPPRQRRRRS